MGGIILAGALVVICLATTTEQGRAAARQDIKRYEPIAWFVLVTCLAILLTP